ncbi:MAG TPA: SMI1/KNR4 family protein [Bacillus sp. (in: firmicutes)]|uniref:SMI1/KNR4 family protein n=1 Tax=Paenibacillus ehimensis TaxID=79264 RepID=UPI002B9493BD|nr:SMI1/KNR4 family protein [Bacillus sp. (in: firmicutes)]
MSNIIVALRKILDESNGKILLPYSDGEIVPHVCSFKSPATAEDINLLETTTGFKLPDDYRNFLETCNGCSLFDHHLYGGEAKLYSAQEVIERYHSRPDVKNLLQVAWIYQDILVIDFDKVAAGEKEYMFVKQSGSFYRPGRSLFCNFETWLDRFISSNGSKYWGWKIEPNAMDYS